MVHHGVIHETAVNAHERTARRHDAAAVFWEGHGEADWAEFERGCAAIEMELAQLERERLELARLRAAWFAHPSAARYTELVGRTKSINVRAATLREDDAVLEAERRRLRQLRDHRQPA
jgi:hypothetical protein